MMWGASSNSTINDSGIDMMRNIVVLSKEYGFTYEEIINMPYSIFLSYLRWTKQLKLEENPEFMKMLDDTDSIRETEPELDRLRNLKI